MILIGIAGASGSGKTSFALALAAKLGQDIVSVISVDDYYHDYSALTEKERSEINYDHPDTIELDLLYEHLVMLKQGTPVQIPRFELKTLSRSEGNVVEPKKIILLEGLYAFSSKNIRNIMELKIFLNTPLDICLKRRIDRVITQHGYEFLKYTIERYEPYIKPMCMQYVMPQMKVSDIVVSNPPHLDDYIEINIVPRIKTLLTESFGVKKYYSLSPKCVLFAGGVIVGAAAIIASCVSKSAGEIRP